MIKEKISMLPYEQLVEIAGIPLPLVSPQTNNGEDYEWVISFVEFISGQSNWDSVINKYIESNNLLKAFNLFCLAKSQSIKILESTTENVLRKWDEFIDELIHKKDLLIKSTGEINEEAIETKQLAQSFIQDLQELALPESFPASHQDLEVASLLVDKLNKYERDSQELVSLSKEELTINKESFHELAQKALQKFFELLKTGSLRKNTHEALIFEYLPALILEKDLTLLKEIADSNSKLESIKLPTIKGKSIVKKHGSLPHKRHYTQSSIIEFDPYKFDEVPLCPYSSDWLRRAPKVSINFCCDEDLEKIRVDSDNLLEYHEKALLWLGASKSCQEKLLQRVAIGEGLLVLGMHLVSTNQYHQARKCLLDALHYVVLSGNYADPASVENAVVGLLVSYISPRLGYAKDGVQKNQLVENPLQIYDLLRTGRFLDIVGKIWASEITIIEAADEFLNIVKANLGDDKTLYKKCAEQLLNFSILIKQPEKLPPRLLRLLHDASPSKKLTELFETIKEEIFELNTKKISIYTKNILLSLADQVRSELEKLGTDNVSPVHDVKVLLPDLLEKVARSSKSKISEKPNILIQLKLKNFFPDERSEEIELPVLVTNAEGAAPASDVFLIIENENIPDNLMPEIEDEQIEVGDLQPGQSKEVFFILNLPEKLTHNITNLSFLIRVKIGDFYQYKEGRRIEVGIKPSLNRANFNNPYTPGSAVSRLNFIGRDKEITRIRSTLLGDSDQRVLILYGIRRIGKTSILKYIKSDSDVTKQFIPILWDVEEFPKSGSSSKFIIELIEKIVAALPRKVRKKVAFSRGEIQKNPFYELEKFLSSISEPLYPQKLLLLFDETDKLLSIIRQNEEIQKQESKILTPSEAFLSEVIGALRKATMVFDFVYIIFAGLPDILDQEYQSRLFGLADPIEIKAFDPQDAEKVISVGKNILKIETPEKNAILNISGMQPYLLQVLCSELFNRMKYAGRDILTEFDLKETVKRIIEKDSIFTDYKSLIGIDNEDYLYGLALAHRVTLDRRKYVSCREIQEALTRVGVEATIKEILAILSSFNIGTTRPFVERDPHNKERFRLIIGLLGDYLIKKKGQYYHA
ncbi:hypothetical protein ACFLZ5_04620 [Thermodesulfobacteriota bacterium]